MKTLIKSLLVVLMLTVATYAQDRVSASVLYTNIQAENKIRPGATVGLDITLYDAERLRLSLIADISYNFDTKRTVDIQTAFGGFRLGYKANGSLTVFGHGKFGASKSKYINSTQRYTPYPASAFGGGVDFKVTDRLSVRVLQVDAVNVDRLTPRFFVQYGSGLVVHIF